MEYEIKGGVLPVLELRLSRGESVISETGGMAWRSSCISMETTSDPTGRGGGWKNLLGRAFSGEGIFLNRFTCDGQEGNISFTSCFPGNIVPVEIKPGRDIICQKRAFLASSTGVDLSVFFQKKLGVGFWGGEGFIMQRLSGSGIAFLEIDGSFIEYNLKAGESLIVDQGHIATISDTCTIDLQWEQGWKNRLFGGNGWCNAIVTGPGRLGLQTMTVSRLAASVNPYITHPEANNGQN